MDADDDESPRKHSPALQHHTVTAAELPTTVLQCDAGELNKPSPASGENDEVATAGEFSEVVDTGTSMENRDEEAEVVEEKDTVVMEAAEKTELSEVVGLAAKNLVTDLASESHEMEVMKETRDEVSVEESLEDETVERNDEEGNDVTDVEVELKTEEVNVIGGVDGNHTEVEEEEDDEEVANGTDLVEEEADAATCIVEEEDTEEQSRSVSGGGKRNRVKNSKTTGRVPSRKKTEEEVCFICFDHGGELVLCDRRGCPKAYHSTCVNRDEASFRAKGKWNCGRHLCSNCEKNAYYMCYTCTFSLCKGCIKDAVILCVRGNKGFCKTCMRTLILIEQDEQQGSKDLGQLDFNDRNSWEYLFKDYYLDLKERLSLTYDEISQAKNPWKESEMFPAELESPDESFYANNDEGSHSDSSSEDVYLSTSKRRKAKKRLKSRSKVRDSDSALTVNRAEGSAADDSSEWASNELLEFVMHMRNGDKSVLSQFDVQALLLEYIKRNKLRDPRRKSQIICDARLQNLFGKPRVGHFEMLKLLESHFLLKEDFPAEDLQGSVVDTEVSQLEGDGNFDSYLKTGKDKRRKTRKKGDERGLQSNVDDYAAIDNHNINLIYLRRNLMEDLLEDTEKFHDIVVGSFVRIRISGSGQKQDLYRLVQVVGVCKAAEPYKVGKRMADILLEILNLNKTEIVSIDIISNQEFTEDECKRLRQSIKCGLINRLTVGDIQDKAMVLQAVRVKDWLETEIVRLSHLRDRASEKGHRKELRECVEKLQLLKTPEEQQRRLEEIPEIHADPNMNPSYESGEDEDDMDDKRHENYMRPRGSAFGWRGREMVSPRSVSITNDYWSGARNHPNLNRELSRNLSNKGFPIKRDDLSNASEALNAQYFQGRDRESQLSNSWERPKLSSSFESGSRNTQPVVTSDSFSTAVLEVPTAPSSTGIAPPVVKINETEKMWQYQDPSGKIQGPFSMVQLRKWNSTGYFPSDLKIWRIIENRDEAILLKDAFAGKNFKEASVVDKLFPKAQTVHGLHYSSPYSGKSHLAAQGIDGQVEGKPTFDQNSGSLNSHSILGSSGQITGGNWRSKDDMNSLTSRPSPWAVEIPHNPADGWGSDASVRNESTNLPSPTPQVAAVAPALASGVDIKTAGANVQNLVVSSRNSHAEAQGWGSGLAPKPEPQRIEPNNPATMPTQPLSHGHLGDASSVQNSASFSTRNPTGNFPMPGFPGMTTPDPWRPPTSSNQSNIAAPAPPNIPWGSNVAENQNTGWGVMPGNPNTSWGGPLPANVNMNWMPAQMPAPGNANPGWAAPSQGPSPVNAVGLGAPGHGHTHVNANAGWVVPGQGPAPGSANPGWASSAGNPSMRGSEHSHARDSGYGAGKPWNRQSSFSSGGRGGGSSRPPFGGQRGVCKFHESGHCKKGASCDFLHP
ncbi:zinc finger CCCH domain-containing protein 19-like isoform X1 [Gastrolobium bilobum]|uniref:zinc finger CCCH domain-containing protein 19-like isoform X1 n=1 Tax=Gastrolobium bilobum TaxID=150636 RepID=UPI002AB2C2C5|nr:zinc finger CCCH domain-containing protein 19-like isoform X1 [Gastrolobium bilobum]